MRRHSSALYIKLNEASCLTHIGTEGQLYFAAASVGTASTADSNAMNKTQGALPAQDALCGSLAGP